MKTKLLVLFILASTIYSCKKDNIDPGTPAPETIPMNAYFPLSIGNYWVYEFTTRLPDGTVVGTPSIDTLKITGDTLIQSYTYYILETNKPSLNTSFMRRDSLGYIINTKGAITLFPSGNEGIFNFHYGFMGAGNTDTLYSYWEEFQDGYSLATPAGNYTDCLAQLVKHQAWPNYGGHLGIDTNYYSEIGIIQRSFSYLSGAKNIGILLDYHLEE